MNKKKARLQNRVREVQQDLQIEKEAKAERKKQSKERVAFEKLPQYTKHEFWCTRCAIDFVAPAYKVWSEEHETASWCAFCPKCGSHVHRYITHKTIDPYYLQSVKMAAMRSVHEEDMLQPDQFGFKVLYGDVYESMYQHHQQNYSQKHQYAMTGLEGKIEEQEDTETEVVFNEMQGL